MYNTVLRKIDKGIIKYPVHTSIDFSNDFEDKVVCSELIPKFPGIIKIMGLPMLAVLILGIIRKDAGMMFAGSIWLLAFFVVGIEHMQAMKEVSKEGRVVLNVDAWNNLAAIRNTLSEIDEMKRYIHRMEIRGVEYELFYDESTAIFIVMCNCDKGKDLSQYSTQSFYVTRDGLGNIKEIDLSACDEVYDELLEMVKADSSK